MKEIYFKYHPNLEKDQILEKGKGVCQCCNQEVEEYLTTMYCIDNIDCICLECVASGVAAKKFNGEFVQDAQEILDQDKKDELFKRTPGYVTWQGEYWLACCDDYCAFIGSVGTKELEEMHIADEVFEEYNQRGEYDNVRQHLTKDGDLVGYLFQCLHCGKYHLWVDGN